MWPFEWLLCGAQGMVSVISKSASAELPAHILLSKSYLPCIYPDILINNYFLKRNSRKHTCTNGLPGEAEETYHINEPADDPWFLVYRFLQIVASAVYLCRCVFKTWKLLEKLIMTGYLNYMKLGELVT